MKRYLLILLVGALASCKAVYNEPDGSGTDSGSSVPTRSVQFVVKNISVEYGSGSEEGVALAPRRIAAATIQSEGMTDLWVWEGDTLLRHQVSTDADFGAPTIALTVGAHDLTFVASKADGQTWADGVWSCTKVKETYGSVLAYTVTKSSSSKQVQLMRCNGKLQWTIEDAIPATVNSMSISVPQCYGLSATLAGVLPDTYTATASITAAHGFIGYCPSTMVLPAEHAGSSISPTISFDDGTSYTTECTITPNVVTNIHGSFFSGSAGATVSLLTEWGTQSDVLLK